MLPRGRPGQLDGLVGKLADYHDRGVLTAREVAAVLAEVLAYYGAGVAAGGALPRMPGVRDELAAWASEVLAPGYEYRLPSTGVWLSPRDAAAFARDMHPRLVELAARLRLILSGASSPT
jgi:hypothetical protein